MNATHSIPEPDRQSRRERILQAVAEHPPMPAFYRDLLPHVQDPNVGYDQLATLIRNDPGVTMNILRMANTAFFSGRERIDSLRQALVRLGSHRIFQIIVAHGVALKLAGRLDGYDLAPRGLLNHSVGAAVTAENLSRLLKKNSHDMLFTAGLLHDMGKVVVDAFVQETRPEFDALLRDTDLPFDAIENEVLGITHPEAGAKLMERWHFPEEVVSIVRNHHQPDRAEVLQTETLMIHLADTLVYSQGMGDGIDGLRYAVAPDAAERLGLRPRDLELLASETLDQLRELEAMMM